MQHQFDDVTWAVLTVKPEETGKPASESAQAFRCLVVVARGFSTILFFKNTHASEFLRITLPCSLPFPYPLIYVQIRSQRWKRKPIFSARNIPQLYWCESYKPDEKLHCWGISVIKKPASGKRFVIASSRLPLT